LSVELHMDQFAAGMILGTYGAPQLKHLHLLPMLISHWILKNNLNASANAEVIVLQVRFALVVWLPLFMIFIHLSVWLH
jgi:hypothetical protein